MKNINELFDENRNRDITTYSHRGEEQYLSRTAYNKIMDLIFAEILNLSLTRGNDVSTKVSSLRKIFKCDEEEKNV